MLRNPFEVTKAVDFTDTEIESRFVNFSPSQYGLIDPRSATVQYLVGGKGGGRTHLMRYYSYPLQKSRAGGSLLTSLSREGYIGIYSPTSGLDASRFKGAGLEPEAWRAVFAQSMELRLAILLMDVLDDIQATESPWSDVHVAAFVQQMSLQQPRIGFAQSSTLNSMKLRLIDIQGDVDAAVNNAPLTRVLSVPIHFNPGSLIFGLGRIATERLPGIQDTKITYMLDELENLTADQQTYINTLVRHKELPTTFLIGSREWGIKTYRTLSADEENKEGSEFRKIVPERAYSQSEDAYKKFCFDMIVKRLEEAGLSHAEAEAWPQRLQAEPDDRFLSRSLQKAIGRGDRRYLVDLERVVTEATRDKYIAEAAVRAVSFEPHPMLEKLAILHAYQAWSKRKLFDPRYFEEAREFVAPLATDDGASQRARNFLKLWKQDMAAQIYAEHSTELPYSGIDTLIDMSGHLPRSLLVTLKSITARAEWRREGPFEGGASISQTTQAAGAREAAAWYLNDVRPLGRAGNHCDSAIRRLGSFLRDVRYSDKPTEVNVTTFSSNLEGVDEETEMVIGDCVRYRMLLPVDHGRQARNRGTVHKKYQLHPMLAPFFGLGLGRRGDLTLTGDEVSRIFSPAANESDFRTMVKRRVGPMNAPFTTSNPDQLF